MAGSGDPEDTVGSGDPASTVGSGDPASTVGSGDPASTVDPGDPGDPVDTGPAGGRVAAVALAVVALAWACVLVLMVGVLVAEAITLDDRTCAVPGVPAAEADVTWQWWPPGAVCSLGGQRLSEPAAARAWAIPGLVVVGIGLLVLARGRRDRPDPDWTS